MKTLKTIFNTLLVLVLLAIGWVWSGAYNMAADVPHTRPVHVLLEWLRQRSIAVRASAIDAPALDDEALIRAGAGNYDAMCSGCHQAPGMAETELSRGLYPAPPNLARAGIADPAAAFWTIKHGVKASGMPAWGRSMADEHIWGMVALLRQLSKMPSQQYRALVASSQGHSHDGGETGSDRDPGEPAQGEHQHDADAAEKPPGDGHEPEHDHGDHPHQAEAASPQGGHDDGEGHDHGPGETTSETRNRADDRSRADMAAFGTPVAAAQALHTALSTGDAGAVQALLDPQVLILESGGAERSRAEYAAHHMPGDMAFLKTARYELQRQTGDTVGDLAWVASEARIAAESKGRPVDLLSTETLVLKKAAEGWKVVHVHWSSRPAAKSSNQPEE